MRSPFRKADAETDELPFADAEPAPEAPRPMGGYRVAGNLEARAMELEQDLVQTRERLRLMEREVFAARKVVRRRRTLTAISAGGVGATIASAAGLTLCAIDVTSAPGVLLGMVVIGFFFGALVGMRWDTNDDFPPAPPPRLG